MVVAGEGLIRLRRPMLLYEFVCQRLKSHAYIVKTRKPRTQSLVCHLFPLVDWKLQSYHLLGMVLSFSFLTKSKCR
jgi:hypothetical protein